MKKMIVFLMLIGFFIGGTAFAEELKTTSPPQQTTSVAQPAPPKVDSGDTTWMLISSALVMLMTPGLALFYGGMVRRKNVLGTIMQSFIALAVITIQWVLYGYSLSFGPDVGHVIGLSLIHI